MSRRIRDYLWPCWVDKGQLAHHCQARPSQLIAPIWAQAQCPFCAVKVLGQAVTSPGPTATPPPPRLPCWPSHHHEVAEPAGCLATPAGAWG